MRRFLPGFYGLQGHRGSGQRYVVAAALAVVLSACRDSGRVTFAAEPMSVTLNTADIRFWIVADSRMTSVFLRGVPDGKITTRRSSGEYDTPTKGIGRVSFRVVLPDGREVAAGDTTVAMRGDWRWDFDLIAATEDPRQTCFGCFGSKSFALPADLRTQGRDSLWLVWGGNSIKDPVTY